MTFFLVRKLAGIRPSNKYERRIPARILRSRSALSAFLRRDYRARNAVRNIWFPRAWRKAEPLYDQRNRIIYEAFYNRFIYGGICQKRGGHK